MVTVASRASPSGAARTVRWANPVIVMVAVALGLSVGRLRNVPPWALLLAVPTFIIVCFVLSRGPLVCLAALVVVDVLGLYQDSLGAGPLKLRTIDLFWVGLVVWMIVVRKRDGQQPGRDIGQRALALWLFALGISLVPVAVHAPGLVTDSVVAWLRVVQTFSLVWLLPYGIRRVKDAEFAIGVVEFAAAAEIIRAIFVAATTGALGARLEGGNSANTEGLLAALLIVAALHAPVPRRGGLRVAYLAVGLVGLFMARSLGATAAVVAALAIFGLGSRAARVQASGLLMPIRVILLILAAVILAGSFRAENLPTSSKFSKSTTVHRAVLATAGLELFAGDPIVGIGWQRSSALIANPALNDSLQRTFGADINPEFLPEKNPTGVHNMYVQMLAEAGIVGTLCLLAFLFLCGRGIRDALRDLRSMPAAYETIRACMVMLVVLAVWWNDNALYGGQPESVIAATLLGVLAASTFAVKSDPSYGESVPNQRAMPGSPRRRP